MRAIEIACPSCKAPPGQRCINVGYGDDPMKSKTHVARARRAHYATLGERAARQKVKP